MKFFTKIMLSALAVFLLSWLLPGVQVEEGIMAAVIVALVISLLNTFVRPIFIFFTLPATIVTLGLFLLVINTCIVLMADWMLDSLTIINFGWALLFSACLSVFNSWVNDYLKEDKKKKVFINSTRVEVDNGQKTVLLDKDGVVIEQK
ncbi:MAG: phage holin family protein [Chitinophagales bacterium]